MIPYGPSGVHNGITAQVAQALRARGGPMRVKEVGAALGLDMGVERNIKRVSNTCLYLTTEGRAVRLGQGIYQLKERNSMDTMHEPATAATNPNGDGGDTEVDPALVCRECGFVGRSLMGLKSHITRAHKTVDHDEAFERSGAALEVLFPQGIPMSRLIEIAELQKQMIRVVSK